MNRTTLLGRLLRGTLVAGAVASSLTAGIALADHGKPANPGAGSLAHRHGASGTIGPVSDTTPPSFVLITKHGDLTITTGPNTTYHARHGAPATLTVGLRANVHFERPDATTLLAEGINLRPAKTEKDAKAADVKAADTKAADAVDAKDAKADRADRAAKRQNAAKAEKDDEDAKSARATR